MRQILHKVIGVAFWVLLVLLWYVLVLEHKAGSGNVSYSVTYVAVVSGAVLAVTFWWIRHNTRIYHRKGPRTGRAEIPPRTDEDRLGRPVRWQLKAAVDGAADARHLIVDLDGAAKVYRRAR